MNCVINLPQQTSWPDTVQIPESRWIFSLFLHSPMMCINKYLGINQQEKF